jgi:LmbE family N-acetylglucosaminyl deacetylase
VRMALQEIILEVNPRTVFLPLGLFHSDHQLTHEAARLLLRRDPARDWFVYADALYRCIPGILGEKLHTCAQVGIRLVPAEITVSNDHERKRRAVYCYRSQLRALTTTGRPGYQDAFAPERYWRASFEE